MYSGRRIYRRNTGGNPLILGVLMKPKLKIHMIANAHLDPVWLWTWPQGLDEAIATCRSACEMLDKYPGLHVTRGEAWIYEQVERHDAALFKNIRRHVKSGRWHIVNGWLVQADCNLPTAHSFMKQAEFGKRYFREKFGVDVNVGYNVDSFGHNAMLPAFLAESGYDAYVFMRPKQHEKKLPANIFIWRSAAGCEVLTFRISKGYCTANVEELEMHVEAAAADAMRNVGHTMCFFGVGNHGGGPTRSQIEWIIQHRDYAAGVELVFSHPRAFFDAVIKRGAKLPVVGEELQMHAVGCYSTFHDFKKKMRGAEYMLEHAENLIEQNGASKKEREIIETAWRAALFNQFHDIFAGTCIPEACEHAVEELGSARVIARKVISGIIRKPLAHIKPARRRRVLLQNCSKERFNGLVEIEPYAGFNFEKALISMHDDAGREIPMQSVQPDTTIPAVQRILADLDMPGMGKKTVEIKDRAPCVFPADLMVSGGRIGNSFAEVAAGPEGLEKIRLKNFPKNSGTTNIKLAVYRDLSDTWSHDIVAFPEKPASIFKASKPWKTLEQGPLRATLINELGAPDGGALFFISMHRKERAVRLKVRVNWHGTQKIVKLLIKPAFKAGERFDGCPGGFIRRPLNGYEFPMHNVVSVSGKGCALAVVSADVFGADVRQDGLIRLTLIRSPYFAHHAPWNPPNVNTFKVMDQGIHEYEIALIFGEDIPRQEIALEITRQSKPVYWCETSKGMRPKD
jgi:alpha-mannosidase